MIQILCATRVAGDDDDDDAPDMLCDNKTK